jgi:hypothetical protein
MQKKACEKDRSRWELLKSRLSQLGGGNRAVCAQVDFLSWDAPIEAQAKQTTTKKRKEISSQYFCRLQLWIRLVLEAEWF